MFNKLIKSIFNGGGKKSNKLNSSSIKARHIIKRNNKNKNEDPFAGGARIRRRSNSRQSRRRSSRRQSRGRSSRRQSRGRRGGGNYGSHSGHGSHIEKQHGSGHCGAHRETQVGAGAGCRYREPQVGAGAGCRYREPQFGGRFNRELFQINVCNKEDGNC